MALTHAYTLSHVMVDRTTDLVIAGITGLGIDPGLMEMLLAGDGLPDPQYAAVAECRPVIGFETTQVATLLAEGSNTFATVGLAINASAILKCWLHKLQEGGTRAAGASHVLLAMNEGLLVPRTLTADSGGARLACEAVATWDGTNDPVTLADTETMLGTPLITEAFVHGPVNLNGSDVDGVQSIRIDFGLGLVVLSGGGEPFPRLAAIMTRVPQLAVTVSDAGILEEIGLVGKGVTASDSVAYLRKVQEGGTRVAAGTNEHIKFTVNDGRFAVRSIPQTHGAVSMAEVVIQPTWDGTNAILVVDTTSAIT